MNNIELFKNERFGEIRTLIINDEIWFVGKDVANALGYSNSSKAIIVHIDNEDKIIENLPHSQNGNMVSKTTLINESGLYSLILSSKLPQAKEFKRWVTDEVLPTIRKHGAYLTSEKIEETLLNPDVIIKLAKTLKEEQKKVTKLSQENEKLNKKIMLQEPKVIFAEAVKESTTSIYVGELAKILKQNGLDIGQNRLFDLLRKKGYLAKNKNIHTPTQKSMDLGLFEIKESIVQGKINKTVVVTGKGQVYFVNLFINKNRERVIENVDLVYVYENQDREYFINYEEVRNHILNKYGNNENIKEAMEDIDVWIDTIPDKKGVSEITTGKVISGLFNCIKFSLGIRPKEKIDIDNIKLGLVACYGYN